MPGDLDTRQKTFLLSFLANLGSALAGPGPAYTMYNVLWAELQKLQPVLGRRDIVWGPAVFQSDPGGLLDNLMYVTHDPDAQQLVVSIAGTNPNSIYDWFIEDWRVGQVYGWPYGDPPADARISAATATALGILQLLRPQMGLPGAGQDLAGFLGSQLRILSERTEVVTTGHSLGGAASPVVAMWLADTRNDWDPGGVASISNWAYAGPTPGNKAFSDYVGSRLGASVHRVANGIDPTVLGWTVADLQKAKTVFAPAIPENALVSKILSYRESEAAVTDYAHIDPSAKPLEGSVNPALIDPLKAGYDNYHAQNNYQHVEEYFYLLDLPWAVGYQRLIQAALWPLAGTVSNALLPARLAAMRARFAARRVARRLPGRFS